MLYFLLLVCVRLHKFQSVSSALEPTCVYGDTTGDGKQYRKDYVYSPRNDVFYKHHMEPQEFDRARDLCNNEGAELMVPYSWHDVLQLDKMLKNYSKLDLLWIGDDFKEQLSIDCVSSALEPTCVYGDTTGDGKQYRKDYVYSPRNDVFYKHHMEPQEFDRARDLCNNEGAELMVPYSWHDVLQLDKMLKNYSKLDLLWIGDDFKEQLSIDFPDKKRENHHNALTINATIVDVLKTKKLHFICKVKATDAPFNSTCNIHGKGYQYYEKLGSCYRISNITMTWFQANSECEQEGAHLVILNSNSEKKTVRVLIRKAPKNPDWNWYSAGFIRANGTVSSKLAYRTIFGESLEEAGYNQWVDGEPNNHEQREYCGTIAKYDSKLNDFECDVQIPFICEKEIH